MNEKQSAEELMKKNAKKSLWKRPSCYLGILLLLVCLAACFFGAKQWQKNHSQKLNLAGYSICVPKQWAIRLESEVAVFYENEASEEPIGKARLLNTETEEDAFGKWFYFETEPRTSELNLSYEYPLTEQHYEEGDFRYALYVFSSLPNPQPYHFAMYFDERAVSKRTIRHILKSFFVPDAGKNPPPKNIEAPSTEEIAESAVYQVISEPQTKVYGIALFEDFLRCTESEEAAPSALPVLSYRQENGVLALDNWRYLDFDGEKILLYQYYQTDSGVYSYNNNPKQLFKIEQEKNEEENTTAFYGVFASGERAVLFEYPSNPYEEEKDVLYAMRETKIGDNSAVGAILDVLPSPGLVRDSFSLQTEKAPYGITVNYSVADKEQAYADGKLNRSPLEKNAAMIFSLVENADVVTVLVSDGEKEESLKFYREKTESYFGTDVREYAEEPKAFRQYAEEVQNMPPSEEKKETAPVSEGVVGEVVYSTTVTIPHGMKVTHPRTGEKVVIDPYAERYGYAQYLGKPISCVIYRTGSGYRLVASCGGSVLGEYAMANDRDKAYVIGMIQAYGG